MMSTRPLTRGSGSPLRTRRSSASLDGRVLVGSMPQRLYIARVAAVASSRPVAVRERLGRARQRPVEAVVVRVHGDATAHDHTGHDDLGDVG